MPIINVIKKFLRLSGFIPFFPIFRDDYRISKINSWYVNTELLKYQVDKKSKDKNLLFYFCKNGDWDTEITPIKETEHYKILKHLYNDGNTYNRRETIEYFLKRSRTQNPFNNNGIILDNKQRVEKYVDYCIRILVSMKNNGFDEKLGSGAIGVAISRKGEILKTFDGRHRLSAAILTNTPYVKIKITNLHRVLVQASFLRFSDIKDTLNEYKSKTKAKFEK